MYSKQSYDQNPTQGCKRGVELHFGTDGAHPFCRRLLAKRHLGVEGIQKIRDFAYYGALFVPLREVRGSVKGLSTKKNLVWDLPVTEAGEKCWMMDSSQRMKRQRGVSSLSDTLGAADFQAGEVK